MMASAGSATSKIFNCGHISESSRVCPFESFHSQNTLTDFDIDRYIELVFDN
jgi:hypothetical protein